MHGGEALLVVVEGAAQDLELVADLATEALVEVLLAEQLIGELHGDQQGGALQAGAVGDPSAAREQLEVGVDVIGELVDVIGALIAADGELLPGDLDLNRPFHGATIARGAVDVTARAMLTAAAPATAVRTAAAAACVRVKACMQQQRPGAASRALRRRAGIG